jgi:hypothetical protein
VFVKEVISMSTTDYPKDIADFREALLKDDDVQTKFRAAFPKIASWLLDGDELSDDELEALSGGTMFSIMSGTEGSLSDV